ncbi:beta-N-acetylhexosaminidase [Loktanella sp. D2R18]|uniref:beta-N-acetylhexosaminidase n=1 Tax=Rhodobacterales TaxID=204455 RepID=UPI000DE815F0|nr:MULTISPECIES: family 20 glycosylhydrolase [Rhodobacterales]MDO6591899.1 family 20 glycosylhydrolase [Yoonia sp. 1_MG-2023]RBW42670.1 beta-N-acetylhexosaminidase [Loktanella sp. D2R18]
MSFYRLDAHFNGAATREDSRLTFTFHNLSEAPLTGFKIGYSASTRIAEDAAIHGADFSRIIGNYNEFSAPDGLVIRPGGTWTFGFTGIEFHIPSHLVDGPKSAILLIDGETHGVRVGDLYCEGLDDTGPLRDYPQGETNLPLLMQPWPEVVTVSDFKAAPRLFVGEGTTADRLAVADVAELHKRLHPAAREVFRLDTGDLAVNFVKTDLADEAYGIAFASDAVTLSYGTEKGRFYGLVTLAQLTHGAAEAGDVFKFPRAGMISDQPRFGWRGGHLDVSRHFYTIEEVMRLIDIMAWAKMNVFQWHLTDDEGWRIQINAYPELTDIGAVRGPESPMVGQYAHVAQTYGGYYTQDEARAVVAHADALHIDVVPEIDIPGHCAAVLYALPHLVDPDEPANSYKSVQGFTNNALNPGIPETYEFIETVMAEIAEIFPGQYVHVGADEVATGCWMTSPKAKILMQAEGLQETAQIQAHFLRKIQAILRRNGKNLAGWDEVSHGGGVDQQGTLLVAWQRPDLVPALTAEGYRVIASPGQAYYMDMVQSHGWDEPGAQWAGVVPPQQSYDYDPEGDLPKADRGALAGVQACIWTEHIFTQALFNHLVFPRFYAVAEAGWTPMAQKDWLRFCALSRHMPQL